MIKLVKIFDEYHLVDTDGRIRAEKDLCLNYIASAFARFKGLDYCRKSLSKVNCWSEDGTTNLFEGIDLAIGSTMKHEFEELATLDIKKIEKLIGKTDKALEYVNKRYKPTNPLELSDLIGEKLAMYKAYQQAEQDNAKNIFTIEDMEHCFNESRKRLDHPDWDSVYDDFQDFCNKTISKHTEITEWEAEVIVNHVSADPNSTTKFKPFNSIEILKLTPIKH